MGVPYWEYIWKNVPHSKTVQNLPYFIFFWSSYIGFPHISTRAICDYCPTTLLSEKPVFYKHPLVYYYPKSYRITGYTFIHDDQHYDLAFYYMYKDTFMTSILSLSLVQWAFVAVFCCILTVSWIDESLLFCLFIFFR